ncbi:hypothetical protein [Photobacterium phosphoreum]|uniref:hypothetical protein n=1 Tax=Photobacterium phosphoreum TaxID=659 RepID=UPI0005D3B450|nr:hypothetical protein [Photobacterium phosphoreum]KJF88237.1 hypothetical protein UB41_02520 [Photobacterium phosphoreum]
MKVGQLEGTPEEIKNLVENHGLNLNDYLIKPDKPICLKWVIAPSIGFSISLICTYIFGTSSEDEFIGNLFFLLTMGLALWLTVVIQIRHKKYMGIKFVNLCTTTVISCISWCNATL